MTAVVNDGAYGGDGVSSLPADARPRTPYAPCDLEADERDGSSVFLNPLSEMRSFQQVFSLSERVHVLDGSFCRECERKEFRTIIRSRYSTCENTHMRKADLVADERILVFS